MPRFKNFLLLAGLHPKIPNRGVEPRAVRNEKPSHTVHVCGMGVDSSQAMWKRTLKLSLALSRPPDPPVPDRKHRRQRFFDSTTTLNWGATGRHIRLPGIKDNMDENNPHAGTLHRCVVLPFLLGQVDRVLRHLEYVPATATSDRGGDSCKSYDNRPSAEEHPQNGSSLWHADATKRNLQLLPVCLNHGGAAGPSCLLGGTSPTTHRSSADRMEFDGVYGTNTNQEMLFKELFSPLAAAFLQGSSAAALVYGGSKSGKSFCLEGQGGPGNALEGAIPRTVFAIFSHLARLPPKHFTLKATLAGARLSERRSIAL
eukprot:1189973-Prorocentrum_minimum.AAC.1